MKKENFISLIVYLIMIAVGVVAGSTVLSNALQNVEHRVLFAILSIGFALLLNIICIELLHALGAKVGGYQVESINILGLCFEKKNDKWSTSFRNFNGLTGETIISPKEEKLNLKQYIWFPLLGYLVELALCLTGYFVITYNDNAAELNWLAAMCIIFIIISSMLGIYNIVPLKLDSRNDGYMLVILNNKTQIEAFNEMERIQHLQRNGLEVNEIKEFEEQGEFSSIVNLMAAYHHIENKDYEKANVLLDKLVMEEKKVTEEIKYMANAQKLYILLLTEDINVAREYYDKNFKDKARRFVANDTNIESLRAYTLIAGMLDDSQSEVESINKRIDKIKKDVFETNLRVEIKLIEEAKEMIYQVHTDWKKESIE